MSVVQSLPEVDKRFIQDCPLCDRSNRIVVKGVYRSESNKGQLYPDTGYSFCNCKNIFYTDYINIREDHWLCSRKDPIERLRNVKSAKLTRLTMPDPFFVEWNKDPYTFLHWNLRRNHIIWDMDQFCEEVKEIGYKIVSCQREFNINAEHPQTFTIALEKP